MNPKVYPTLSAYGPLVALVTDRIWPVTAPQDTERPYVVFTPVGVSTEMYFANPDDVDYDRVSIDCWADNFPAADAIAKACRAALMGNGYLISGFSDYEDDTKLYRVTFDLELVTTPL